MGCPYNRSADEGFQAEKAEEWQRRNGGGGMVGEEWWGEEWCQGEEW
jgi:hypothetical protein